MDGIRKQALALVDSCIQAGKKERPENLWIKDMYERFRKEAGGLKKGETDACIYREMYGTAPEKVSDTLKIRYWRTGRHLPSTREQCVKFGHALKFSEAEMKYLVQSYYDHSDLVFGKGSKDILYLERKHQMDLLIQEYLEKIHPVLKQRFYRFGDDMEHSLRHLYYTDAKSYLKNSSLENMEVGRHITSINYESEFNRNMNLIGEISRKTMIRHVFLFSMPFINSDLMSRRLEAFGYLPLVKEHTQADGSCLDRLVLGLLGIYGACCNGKEPLECLEWFHQLYAVVDQYLEKQGNTSLRFLYFKALRGSEYGI